MRRLDKLENELDGFKYQLSGLSNAVTQLVELVSLREPDKIAPKNKVGVVSDARSKEDNLSVEKVGSDVKAPPEKKQSFGKKMTSIGKSFLLNTTIHGVGRAANTQRFVVRILWSLMIGLSAYCCVYTLYKNIHDYMDYEVVTVTRQIEEEKVVFPAVTVCAVLSFSFKYRKLSSRSIDFCYFEDKKCSPNDFEWFYRDKYSYYCLRYNGHHQIPGTNRTYKFKKIPDVDSTGLKLRLNLNVSYFRFYVQDNYVNTFRYKLEYNINQNENFRVYVTKSVDKRLGEPHNNCIKTDDKTYRQDNCLEICANQYLADNYNCSAPYAGFYRKKLPACRYPVLNMTTWYNYYRWFDGIRKQCMQNCTQECDTVRWNSMIIPGDANKGKTVINVMLEKMDHLQLTQIAKTTFWDLLSSLGGTLGFLGMSFLTFVEIFEFVFELIRNIVS